MFSNATSKTSGLVLWPAILCPVAAHKVQCKVTDTIQYASQKLALLPYIHHYSTNISICKDEAIMAATAITK